MILLVTPSVIAANKPDSYQVIKHITFPGHTSTNGAHIKFSSFRIPEHNVLAGPSKAAATIITQSFTSSAALVGAMSVGIMAAAFEAALEFAQRDSRGGKEGLLNRQSVADLLMDVKMRADAARFLTWKAADAVDKGLGGELALEAKIFCSDMAVKAIVDAMSAVGMWVSLVMYIWVLVANLYCDRSSYNKDGVFPALLNDAMCLPLFDGGNVGIRRRQLEKLFIAEDYQPWASTFG